MEKCDFTGFGFFIFLAVVFAVGMWTDYLKWKEEQKIKVVRENVMTLEEAKELVHSYSTGKHKKSTHNHYNDVLTATEIVYNNLTKHVKRGE